jgi:hypothetical protein
MVPAKIMLVAIVAACYLNKNLGSQSKSTGV